MSHPWSVIKPEPAPLYLRDLFQEIRDLCDSTFFLCDAVDGMLSIDLVLEPETINGYRLSSDALKTRVRSVAHQLDAIYGTDP